MLYLPHPHALCSGVTSSNLDGRSRCKSRCGAVKLAPAEHEETVRSAARLAKTCSQAPLGQRRSIAIPSSLGRSCQSVCFVLTSLLPSRLNDPSSLLPSLRRSPRHIVHPSAFGPLSHALIVLTCSASSFLISLNSLLCVEQA